MKAVTKSVEGSDILATQAKVGLQTTGFVSQLLKSKDKYECLVEPIETMESAEYIITESVQTIQKTFDFGKGT